MSQNRANEVELKYEKLAVDTIILKEFKIKNASLNHLIDSFLLSNKECIEEAKNCVIFLSLERKRGSNYIHLSINDYETMFSNLEGVIVKQRPIFIQSRVIHKMKRLLIKTGGVQTISVDRYKPYSPMMVRQNDTIRHFYFPDGSYWFYKQKRKDHFREIASENCDLEFIKKALGKLEEKGWSFPVEERN